ncbi:MAG: OmpA family protein [Alphaproteobacteria bacterium]
MQPILLVLTLVLTAPAHAQTPPQRPGEIQQPRGTWQTPGQIQQPRGTWQQPGEIQTPRGIQAIRADRARCDRRYTVAGDALFAFDKSDLSPEAVETLTALAPMLAPEPKDRIRIEGHTDSVGGRAYNMTLSEARARAVRDWLARHGHVPATTPVRGFGFDRPVAPNRSADGKDDPAGRQRNRRVEVVVDACR